PVVLDVVGAVGRLELAEDRVLAGAHAGGVAGRDQEAAAVGVVGQRGGGIDVVLHAAGTGVDLVEVGGVALVVDAEAQQVVAQAPLEVDPALLALVVAVVDGGVVGAAQRHARVRHAGGAGDVVAVHVVGRAGDAVALVAAVHHLHRQVVGQVRAPGQRPVGAAGLRVGAAELLSYLADSDVAGGG